MTPPKLVTWSRFGAFQNSSRCTWLNKSQMQFQMALTQVLVHSMQVNKWNLTSWQANLHQLWLVIISQTLKTIVLDLSCLHHRIIRPFSMQSRRKHDSDQKSKCSESMIDLRESLMHQDKRNSIPLHIRSLPCVPRMTWANLLKKEETR